MSREFTKEIKREITEKCKEIGFKKKQNFYIKPYTENVIAVLFFGFYSFQMPGHVFVAAFVGVTYKDVEEIFCKLCGIANPVFDYTILGQIGYVMPENSFKEWDMVEGSDNTGVFEDLFKNIKTYGFEYFEKMKDFNNLFQTFEIRGSVVNVSRDRRLPILYYLKGEKEKGLKFIEEAIERENTPVDMESLIKESQMTFPDAEVTIITSGPGRVDPEYLEFKERYKALP